MIGFTIAFEAMTDGFLEDGTRLTRQELQRIFELVTSAD